MLRVARWFAADVHASLAVALVVPVLVVEAVHGFVGSGSVLAFATAYLGFQVGFGLVLGRARRGVVGVVRLVLAVAFVGGLELIEPQAEATLPVLYVPIIVLAAAMSGPAGLVVSVAAASAARIAIVIEEGTAAALDQSILPLVVVAFLAFGTRHVVASLERSVGRFRRVVATDRRRARRMRAIEQVGRVLAQDGPSPAALETIMDVLEGTFGYHYPSVYLWTGNALRLGAQRGYEHPILEFDLEVGIIGRVARTRQAVFAPDVTREPEYAQADPAVVSEISVPLLADDDLLGVLNVESTAAERLDRDDLASLVMIADRLAASIALGRDRQELAERSALLGRLTEAFARLGAMLDPAPLQAAVATAATTVVACDIGLLTLVDGPSGAFRVAATVGADSIVGMQIDPGEGATGIAIATRTAVLDDRFDQARYPRAARRAVTEPAVAVMAIPLLREDRVLGALTFVRREAGQGFSDQEREIAGLLAAQAALAITNANLHSETQEAAIRDPLTQLHNRRLLDDTVARMSASRARQAPDERRPVAAILFDLDHFGELNNRHGHLAGDAVLRAFSGLLAGRFRSSDLVARYGGEEFLVVLDGASRDDAVRAAEEVRLAFRGLDVPIAGGAAVRATVSAGCAALDPSVAGLDVMVEVADVGLAMAKAGGRDQVVAA
ncbi:MAG TPA: diguanylate cyclase [Candidatus Limnocylindrales bacterium]|nr:diguanylate cyclase [Candidatus Limnocylindrales bacterium]